ncbi:MAG TPA: ATP-binding protein [Streptosporangiaceae bacterium]|jgi:hypothetical protein
MGTTGGISIPADPTAQESELALRWRRVFAGEDTQLREARRWLTGLLPDCSARDDVISVATELCSNAVGHTASGSGGTFTLEITWQGATVRVTVADAGAPTGPHLVEDPTAERGRGLLIVSELCTRTGFSGDHRGRLVWGDVFWTGPAAPPAAAEGHEAAIRAGLTSLADRYRGVPAWFGRSTREWWAMPGCPGARQLVTAPTAHQLADLIDSCQARERTRQPHPPDPVAARADRRRNPAKLPAPPRPHPPRPPIGNLKLRPC